MDCVFVGFGKHFLFKQLAVLTGIHFVLVMVNPMSPVHPKELKSQDKEAMDGMKNLLLNLFVNSLIGMLGFVMTILLMLLPFPARY